MTASEKAAVKSAQKASFGKVFAVQIAAYVVLVVLALIPGISYGNTEEPAIVSFTVVASVAMIALLAVFNPFRDGVVGHVISVVVGLLSVVCATTVMLGRAIFPAGLGNEDTFWMQEGWIAGVGGLLILLIVVSFGRQMARENRTHLIRSLSHNVVEGVAMIGSAGWCFLSSQRHHTPCRPGCRRTAGGGRGVDPLRNQREGDIPGAHVLQRNISCGHVLHSGAQRRQAGVKDAGGRQVILPTRAVQLLRRR